MHRSSSSSTTKKNNQQAGRQQRRRGGGGGEGPNGSRMVLVFAIFFLSIALVTLFLSSAAISNHEENAIIRRRSTIDTTATASYTSTSATATARGGGVGGKGASSSSSLMTKTRPRPATDKKEQKDTDTTTKNKIQSKYFMIFSTSCSESQDWQSYVFFYHAMKIQQPGHVIRIASGCTLSEQRALQRMHDEQIAIMSPNFHVHFTPDFSGPHHYKYFNKPWGLLHWMEHWLGYKKEGGGSSQLQHDDSFIMLLDPDQILLQPLTEDFTNATVLWHGKNRFPEPIPTVVKHGLPFASLYGFGNQPFTKVNLTYVTNDAHSPALKVETADQLARYPAGPPYIATARDMYQIALHWTAFGQRTHDEYPHLLAEMFAYCIAAAHLQLPHIISKSFMVSDTSSSQGEGWPLLDKVEPKDICKAPPPPAFVLHYCQRYMLGKWFIGKYRLRKDFIHNCQAPLLKEPPSDLALKYNYFIPPDGRNDEKKELKNPGHVKRHAYMLCQMIPKLNQAATFFKQHHCSKTSGGANLEKTYIFHDSIE